jgi:alpha-N-arabinofuranosidase
MTGMERNSDVILISSYAPLFVNVSDARGGRSPTSSMQWPTDLVGYDALSCYGSPAFYAQKMFSLNHGDQILATDAQNLPNEEYQPPARRGRGAPATAGTNAAPAPLPPKQILPSVFFDATRDSQAGIIYVKIVNIQATAQPVEIKLDGVASVAANGEAIVLSSASEDDTNTLNDPQKVVPHTVPVQGVSKDFTQMLAPYSITILKLAAK